MNSTWKQYITILKNVVKPALGCTEPICAAYATSVATQMLGEKPETIDVFVSDNLYKNSMGVFVPRTGRVGLAIAAATGATGGNPEAGLEVLAKLTESQVNEAQQLIDAGRVQVKREATEEFIYCRVVLKSSQHHAEVTISGGHTLIVEKRLDGNVIFSLDSSLPKASTASICDGVDITISSIYDFAIKAEFNDIKFILEAKELNIALAQEGLNNPYGLEVGRTYQKNIDTGLLSKSLDSDILIYTSAASDARMGGATLPAMSNYGSGNQGIAATIPVVKMADFYNADEETLARAFIMSHLGAIYIKSHYPPLSAFCGNAVTSAAAAMAMVYLAGGTFEQSCSAIQNTISDTSGMICDGAKSTCAMKVGSSAQSAMKSSLLALNNHCVTKQGVIGEDVEKTIKNIGRMITTGMPNIDHEIIEIMAS